MSRHVPGGRATAALSLTGALALALTGLAAPAPAHAATDGSGLVISEAYTRGGSTGASYQQKFVEILNPTGSAVSLEGLSLQYVSAPGGAASATCALTGTVEAGGTFLVIGGSNGSNGAALTGDEACAAVNPAAASGTLAIVRGTTARTFPSGTSTADADVVDLLGWGSAASYEGTAAQAAGSTAESLQRAASGTDTDDNAADFTAGAPTPTGSGTTPNPEPTAEPSTSPTAEPTAEPTSVPTATPTASTVSIADIQGTGDSTALAGQTVTTRGVVTAVYATGGFSGYYIQTPGSGTAKKPGDASDGLFVYDGDGAASLAVGDCLDVTGTAGEYNGLTQLSKVSARTAVADCAPATPVEISESSWIPTDADKEPYEGMLLRLTGSWTVTDNYSTNQYGQLGLAVGDEPLYNATDVVAPGAEATAYEASNAAKEINLDDGSSWNYTSSKTAQAQPLPYLVADDPVRAGAAVTFTKDVVLDYRFGWNLQPQAQVNGTTNSPVTWENTRTAAPQVGDTASVASFNVLNYFTDLGQDETGCSAYEDKDGNPVTAKSCEVRGAYTPIAFEHQQAKIVAAINELDASVVGLEEIENSAKFGHDRDASLAQLVDALNAAAGETKWTYVPSPTTRPALADEDVIRNAFIYQPALVTTVGESSILDDAAFNGTARQPLAQAFKAVGADDSQHFVVITNHFKSKGSVLSGEGNADSGDGQGANNAQRVLQAKALTAFAAQWSDLPTVILGDFNSYSKEDPITTIESAGYRLIDAVVAEQGGSVGKSYQFDGRIGSLDHVLLNDKAAALVTGGKVWDVNADESIAFEYSRENDNVTQLWAGNPYRASDHDPVKVGLRLATEPVMPADVAAAAASGKGEVLQGDWDGDGVVTYALRSGDTVTFYAENAEDSAVWARVTLGKVNHEVFVGDWDGDGADELALRKGANVFYQRSADSPAMTRGRVNASLAYKVERQSDGRDALAPVD
ncbi:ExeM/NucH family extracellular endonuclease [Actinomyces haliotis]|uniref:ExeM/NucH family extracellular endonuclease n=1 Tax=Actinomyces haliotis TaxID=1280843 RepID=UPI0018905D1C|nr:ExeM/NucH family extracellular endonuclease [Actinomyces haliotis]